MIIRTTSSISARASALVKSTGADGELVRGAQGAEEGKGFLGICRVTRARASATKAGGIVLSNTWSGSVSRMSTAILISSSYSFRATSLGGATLLCVSESDRWSGDREDDRELPDGGGNVLGISAVQAAT